MVVNLNHMIKVVPHDDEYSSIYMLGDDVQYSSGYISMRELEMKLRDA